MQASCTAQVTLVLCGVLCRESEAINTSVASRVKIHCLRRSWLRYRECARTAIGYSGLGIAWYGCPITHCWISASIFLNSFSLSIIQTSLLLLNIIINVSGSTNELILFKTFIMWSDDLLSRIAVFHISNNLKNSRLDSSNSSVFCYLTWPNY